MNTLILTGKVSKALYKLVLWGMLLSLFFGLTPVTPAGASFVQPPNDAQSTTGPTPPPQAMRPDSLNYAPGISAHLISNVPAYYWRHGCGPTAAGMVIGYWDHYWDAQGVDWLISGDASSETTVVDEDIASSQGVQNHYTDYAMPIDDNTPTMLADKSALPPGNQHPDNSIADFMHTSRSSYANRYGWSWFSDVRPALLGYINKVNPGEFSATAADYYYSNGSFNWNMFKAEIDAGRPMVLLVDSNGDGQTDHFIPAFGYDDSTGVQMYATHTTWDTSLYWYQFEPMTVGRPWGIFGGTTLNIKADPQADIYVGGVRQGSFILGHGQSARASYASVNNGPVLIQNAGYVPIVASERIAYTPDGGTTWPSYSEVMGLPSGQLTTSYVMPWYNNLDLNTQLRFGNVGTSATTVTVRIGGAVQGTYPLNPNASQRISYAGLSAGPVQVSSSNGVPIIASQRVSYSPDGGTTWTYYSELMGLPASQLTTSYVMPWYNNADLNTQLRFGNVGSTATYVIVKIGGVQQGTYLLNPNQSQRISYPGLSSGPVQITSTGGVPIIASQRVAYSPDGGTTWPSFTELMGLPAGQLTTSYVMPVYNNASLNTQLRFGNVGTAPTNVTVTVGGVVQSSYYLIPSQSQRVSYPGLNSGPVIIQSSGGVPIIASERVAYTPDGGTTWSNFAEMMGLPSTQLTTSYVMPWYNNSDWNTQLRIGVP